MRNRKIINLTFISVVAMVGVIVMQALWVSFTISASRAHTKEHILNILLANKAEICSHLEKPDPEATKLFIGKMILEELKSIQKPLKFKLEIKKIRNDKKITLFENQGINFIIDCKNSSQKSLIHVDCSSNSWIYRGQIFWWAILSILMIVLIAVAIALSLINQHKHKKLEQIKKDFVSNMTHELKTPIATISVASEMLLKADNPYFKDSKLHRYSQIIYDENQRLQKLVDKVLMLSIFDQTGNIYNMANVNLNTSIEEALQSMELLTKEKNAKITFAATQQPNIVLGDKSHLRQIIANILENALKYTKENPEIFIDISPSKESLTIEIGDNGPGISKANKELIFNKFQRASNVNIHNVKGFGLGLFYVRKVMEAHGGAIKVKDNKPKGAIFQLIFPKNSITNQG